MTQKPLFCLLLALLLLLSACGSKLTEPPAEEVTLKDAETDQDAVSGTDGFSLSLSEDYARGLLIGALPENTPYTVDMLDFKAPDTATVLGSVDLSLLAEQYQILSFVSSRLPAGISFSASLRYTYSAEEGFSLIPVNLSVTGFTIPTEVLPASFSQYFAAALNDYVRSLPVPITSVTMTDEEIRIAG